MRCLLVVVCAALVGCPLAKDPKEIKGHGGYKIGTTTAAEGVACSPAQDGVIFCSHNHSPPIAGHSTETDLYFRGTDESAPLVEILIVVKNCDVNRLLLFLQKQLGSSAENTETRWLWRQKTAHVIARVPADPPTCEIVFLHPDEQARLTQLMAVDDGGGL